jgi:hypothetical protein
MGRACAFAACRLPPGVPAGRAGRSISKSIEFPYGDEKPLADGSYPCRR